MAGRYFFAPIISFVFGIWITEVFELRIWTLLFLGCAGLIPLLYQLLTRGKYRWGALIALIGIFFLLGGGRVVLFERITPEPILSESLKKQVALRGFIDAEPDTRDKDTRLRVMLDTLYQDGGTHQVSSRVLVVTDPYASYRYGDTIFIEGVLTKPESFIDERGKVFHYDEFLGKDRIFFVIRGGEVSLVETGGGNPVIRTLLSFKERIVGGITQVLPEPHASLSAGLVFGARQSLGEGLTEAFRRTGIIHIVVLSGYNVTIIAEALIRIFSFLPRIGAFSLGVASIIFFALMTGASATIVRASIMAILVLIARLTGRVGDMMRALFFAGFLMLMHNPKLLYYDVSFQLSFLATLGLLILSPLLVRFMKIIPTALQLREFAVATIATQIFVLPLLWYQMGELSLVALPVNLLVLIAIPLTMLFGFLTGLLGMVSVVLAWPFGFIALFLLSYELTVVNFFAALPFASITVPLVPFWMVAGMYVLFGIGIFLLARKNPVAFPLPQGSSERSL